MTAAEIQTGAYRAHCGRWELHGAHARPVFCVGHRGERITETPTAEVADWLASQGHFDRFATGAGVPE